MPSLWPPRGHGKLKRMWTLEASLSIGSKLGERGRGPGSTASSKAPCAFIALFTFSFILKLRLLVLSMQTQCLPVLINEETKEWVCICPPSIDRDPYASHSPSLVTCTKSAPIIGSE